MIQRKLFSEVTSALAEAPAVCLVGPRQAGKTTLALQVADQIGGQYLDLESEADRAKLADPEGYLSRHLDKSASKPCSPTRWWALSGRDS